MTTLSTGSPRGSAAVDETDENTKRWTTDPILLATERQRAESERSDLRPRPQSGARAKPLLKPPSVPPRAVEIQRVRGLYEQFLHVVGPAAKMLFEAELRQLQLRPSAMTERDFAMLVQRLTLRIPDAHVRNRFKAQALVVDPWP